MNDKKKKEIRLLFGAYLRQRREEVLGVRSVRQLALQHRYDQSKLSKVEKGLVDIRFDTLVDIAQVYQLTLDKLFDFPIPVMKDVKKRDKQERPRVRHKAME